MPGVHDRGGWPDDRPIDRSEHELAPWELRTDALMRILSSQTRQVIRVDELRRAIESIEPSDYESLGYYERWLTDIESLLIEKGVFTRDEVEREARQLAQRSPSMSDER